MKRRTGGPLKKNKNNIFLQNRTAQENKKMTLKNPSNRIGERMRLRCTEAKNSPQNRIFFLGGLGIQNEGNVCRETN
jgi:transposase-like protein